MAVASRPSTSRLAISASTSKPSRSRASRSTVERPMEPVAPRMETRLAILKLHTDDDRQSCRHRYREQAVDPVHQPALTRQQPTRILSACAALEPAFEQINPLSQDRHPPATKPQTVGPSKITCTKPSHQKRPPTT